MFFCLNSDIYFFVFQQVKQGETQRTFESFWPIVLYHVSFFIFITTIGLNIIFGIIVDTFSELRDLKVRFNLNNNQNIVTHERSIS